MGEWLDLDDYTYEEMDAKANEIIKSRPYPSDEYGVHDFEGFGNLLDSFYPSLERIYEIHKLLNEAERNGIDIDVFIAFLENQDKYEASDVEGQIDKFEISYASEHDSLEDWAFEYLEATGELKNLPKHLQYYFDYQSYSRDSELNGDVYRLRVNGKEHIFYTNA